MERPDIRSIMSSIACKLASTEVQGVWQAKHNSGPPLLQPDTWGCIGACGCLSRACWPGQRTSQAPQEHRPQHPGRQIETNAGSGGEGLARATLDHRCPSPKAHLPRSHAYGRPQGRLGQRGSPEDDAGPRWAAGHAAGRRTATGHRPHPRGHEGARREDVVGVRLRPHTTRGCVHV